MRDHSSQKEDDISPPEKQGVRHTTVALPFTLKNHPKAKEEL